MHKASWMAATTEESSEDQRLTPLSKASISKLRVFKFNFPVPV